MTDEELQERLWLADEIYTDGGVIGFKDDNKGGTWAFVVVSHSLASAGPDGYEITHLSGFVPRKIRPVTNNWTEQMAIVRAMELMPKGWKGKICSDSDVALGRVFGYYKKMNNLPLSVIRRTEEAIANLELTYELVAGHPNDEDLERGYKIKKGKKYRVSKWNVLADQLCGEAKNLCVQKAIAVID